VNGWRCYIYAYAAGVEALFEILFDLRGVKSGANEVFWCETPCMNIIAAVHVVALAPMW
jgi:hypothetical protein